MLEKAEKLLRVVNKALLVVLAGASIVVLGMTVLRAAAADDYGRKDAYLVSEQAAYDSVSVKSAFLYREEPYDIHPNRTYVVYTNYACPHCAELHFGAKAKDIEYTSRILLLEDGEGVFATQDIVSAYMLKLYRSGSPIFDFLEDELYGAQATWTAFDVDTLIEWLNDRSGKTWKRDDLTDELNELAEIEKEAPEDLPFVPGVYQDGERRDDVMYALLGAGAKELAAHREEQ